MTLKELSGSPLLKVVNFLLLIIISLLSYSFVSAKSDLIAAARRNENKIELNEGRLSDLEKDVIEIKVGFEYIKEKLDEISQSVKELN